MPELTDVQLLMYLDGMADAQTTNLIEREAENETRVRDLDMFQRQLAAKLFRTSCPSSGELGEFYLGMLSRINSKAVQMHLSECPLCTRELARIESALAPGWIDRIVAQWVSGGKKTALQGFVPQPGLRGSDDSYYYEAEGVQIALDVQEDSQHPGRKVLIGLITGVGGQDFEVSLWQGEKQVASASTDELDNFVIKNLEIGEYELLIRGPRVEIQVQTFMI